MFRSFTSRLPGRKTCLALARVGAHVLSLDWRIDLDTAYGLFGDTMPLQGNLDPCALYGSEASMAAAAQRILEQGRGRPHIFNLGHGVYPDTPYEKVKSLVDVVHQFAQT